MFWSSLDDHFHGYLHPAGVVCVCHPHVVNLLIIKDPILLINIGSVTATIVQLSQIFTITDLDTILYPDWHSFNHPHILRARHPNVLANISPLHIINHLIVEDFVLVAENVVVDIVILEQLGRQDKGLYKATHGLPIVGQFPRNLDHHTLVQGGMSIHLYRKVCYG